MVQRSIVAILLVLVMVASSSASAVGPLVQGTVTPAPVPTRDARLGITHTAPTSGASRSEGRSDFEDQFEVISPYPTNKNINDIAFQPNGNTALLVGDAGLVMVYDGYYFNVVDSNSTVYFSTVSWTPGGEYALIGGQNGNLMKFQNGKITKLFSGTGQNIVDIAFKSDENKALMITSNGDVYMYQEVSPAYAVYFLGTFQPVYFQAIAWNTFQSNTALLAGYEVVNGPNGYHWEGRVFQYDDTATQGSQFTNLNPNLPHDRDTDLYSVAWSPTEELALLGGWNGEVLNYDGSVFGTVASTSPIAAFLHISFNVNGEAILVGYSGGVFTYKSGVLTQVSTKFFNTLFSADWTTSGATAFMVGDTGTVATYDPAANVINLLTVGSGVTFFDAAWKPDWSYALIVGSQGTILKWDGKKLSTISSPTTQTLLGIGWSPNGDTALIVGAGGTLLQYFDGGAGDPSVVQKLSTSNKNLWDVKYSSTGLALMVGDSGEVRSWNGNVATKVVSANTNNLRAVNWKDSTTAYIVGDSQTVLRYQTSPVARIDVSLPNLNNNNALWAGQWKEDKARGLICGANGLLMEHIENNALTTLDDSFNVIDTGTTETLYGMDWNYAETDVLMTASSGKVVLFHDDNDQVRVLQSPSSDALYGAAWKGNTYALVVGTAGAVMKYWPNLKPSAVSLSAPTDITDNSMKITWTKSDAKDFNRYEVHMSTTADFTPSSYTRLSVLGDITITSFQVTNLNRDKTYYFKVRVVDNGGLYADSNQVFGHTIVGKLPPSAVKLYDPTDITDTAMNLAWDANKDTDFDHYELHMSTVSGFTPSGSTAKVTVTDQLQTSTPVQGLKVETQYYFKLRVVDKDGLNNDSNQVTGTTQKINVAPAAVKLNDPFNVTDDSMEFNWSMNSDSDFKQYEIYIGTTKDFTFSNATLKTTITVQNETAYVLSGLSSLTNYYIIIRVVDTGGLSSDSNEVTAETKEFNAPPVAVKLSDPTNITETSMKLNWSRNNDTDFDRYEIYLGNSAGFILNSSTLLNKISTQNQTTYKVTSLTPGTTYFFKIRVYDIAEQFADSNEVNGKTIGNAPPQAVHLAVDSVDKNSVSLSWTKNNDTDFAKYQVYYSTDAGFTPDPASAANTITSASTKTCTIDKLDLNTTYYFVLRVIDDLGAFADSNRVNATTLGPDLPPKALILGEPYNITRNSMQLDWSLSPDKDFQYYELHRSEKAGFKPSDSTRVAKISDINTTTYNISCPKMNTEYHFILRVYDLINQFNDSNEVFAKTNPANQPPIADAGSDLVGFTSDLLLFKGGGIDADGKIVLYEWDFETDGTYDYSNTLTGEITHQYITAGTYTATLRVTDNEGATATDTTTIIVAEPPSPNHAPHADAGPDQTVTVDETVLFDGKGTDDDGTIALYEWDYNSDGNYETSSQSDGSGSYVYSEAGNYKARLRVTDNNGTSSTDTALITVLEKNHVPVAKINKPYDGRSYNDVDPISFDGSTSTDSDGDVLTYKWTDDSTGSTLSTKIKFSTVVSKLGAHTVTLQVSDGQATGKATVDFTIAQTTNQKPTITITDPSKGSVVKGVVIISGRASDVDGTVTNVCVRIDGGTCQNANGKSDWSFEWNTANVENGAHTIKAIATDDRKDTTETSITVSVQKTTSHGKGFMGLPGFEAPVMLAAAALVALAVAARKRKDE